MNRWERAAATRRSRLAAKELPWFRERLALREAGLSDDLAECRRRLVAFCALPDADLTYQAFNALDRDTLSAMRCIVAEVAMLRGEIKRLTGELDGAEVIPFPRVATGGAP